MAAYILALDQGTTSSRAIIFDRQATVVSQHQIEFQQYFPDSGWVEHDAEEIWQSILSCCQQAVAKAKLTFKDIAAIGITNQRETTVLWDKETGKPVYRAIVWQDRRTAKRCRELQRQGHEESVYHKTGLVLDPYFSSTKIAWILDQAPEARKRAEEGKLAFGTIDSFLLWRLTNGQQHATDITNASRTLLFNIHDRQWDKDLLRLFNIPPAILPEVFDNNHLFGKTSTRILDAEIPIAAMAGDQHAALFGQACFEPGMLKSTYGTGAFLVLNTGAEAVSSKNRLLTTVGYQLDGKVTYALEGSIFAAGSIVKWMRDKLGLIKRASETAELASSLEDNGGVYLVPAFTGLGAPYWNPEARGAIQGLTRDSQVAHIVRAGLEAVAYQTNDLLTAMTADYPHPIREIRVDGGMVVNDWLMQFLADTTALKVTRTELAETTALGIAYLTGLSVGWYSSLQEISKLWTANQQFEPTLQDNKRQELLAGWKTAVTRIL